MSIQVTLPNLGEEIQSAQVIDLLVKEGDTIATEQDIIEIETDKATVAVPSSHAGKVVSIAVAKGDEVSQGDLLLTLEADDAATDEQDQPAEQEPAKESDEPQEAENESAEQADAQQQPQEQPDESSDETDEQPTQPDEPSDKPAEPPASAEQSSTKPARAKSAPAKPATGGADIAAGPAVRRQARQLGVDLSRVAGSGPGGRITTDDLYAAVREHNLGDSVSGEPTALQPAAQDEPSDQTRDNFGPVRREPISRLRATIAERMHISAATIPHVTHFDQADITELDAFRRERKDDLADEGLKLTLMPFVIKAVADALAKHPKLNATLDLDAGQIIYRQYVSLGVAVDTDRGLVVPVLRDVASIGIAAIARQLGTLVEKTRSGDFGVDDLRGGTFTLSNQGAVGGQYATPIINHPDSAILLLGRSALQPVVRDGQITPRLLLPLSLSYDHRLIDGADAGRFVNTLKELLEYPGKLLLNL